MMGDDALIDRDSEGEEIPPLAGEHDTISNWRFGNASRYVDDTIFASSIKKNEMGAVTGYTRDVAHYSPSTKGINGTKLASQEGAMLHEIKEKIGSDQFTRSAIAFHPSWVVEEAIKSEHDDKWKVAYTEVM